VVAVWSLLLSVVAGGCLGGPEDDPGVWQLQLKEACPPADVVLGIDIASYQHGAPIDWAQVAAARRFVIIKATEGTSYTNSYYADDSTQARAHGMIVGSYHFLRYTSTGAAQAQHFLDAVGGTVPAGDLPAMLDVENTGDSATAAQRVTIMGDWLDAVESATGRTPMIYSGAWYWAGSYLGTPTGFSDHPLVWAAYTTACPQIPNDFPGLAMWQYLGDTGSTPGISGACDQDQFYGTEADLLALANGGPDYRGESLGAGGQSYPVVADGAVDVEVGQTITGWVKLRNTGKAAWQPGVVFLAPVPRDQASPFVSPSWTSDHRISTVAAAVAPGEVGDFTLDLTGAVVGESILSLGWVAEGVTWFADAPKGGGPADGYFAVKVNVVPSTRDGGPPDGGGGDGGHDGGVTDDGGAGDAAGDAGPGGHEIATACGCRAAGGAGSGPLLALAVAALALRRGRGCRRRPQPGP
jgi:GH25 family lysozyme M1 (1,4-beta-N-acetylmuramidase)